MKVFGLFRRLSAAVSIAIGVAGLLAAAPANAGTGRILYDCPDMERKAPFSSIGVPLYQGTDGWFARAGDIETMYEYPTQTMQMIKRINQVLRSKGTRLILLPMLPRGIAGRNFLPEGGIFPDRIYDADFSAREFDSLIDRIRAVGVTTININDILKKHPEFNPDHYYFKRDIHWTPEAARLVASGVAEQVRQMLPDNPSPVTFATTKLPDTRVIRSNLNKSINELCRDKIPSEVTNLYETKQVVDSLDSLLGDDPKQADHSIHVVGTSFTDESLVFNFDGFLRQALSQNVDGFSLAGGGETQAFYGWATSEEGAARRPKVLIWEFNNADELISVTPYLSQVLTPAIMGDCDAANQSAKADFKDASAVSLDLPAALAAGPDFYLRYEFSNNALRQFKFKFTYANGESDFAVVDNPSRVQNVNKLYHELPDNAESPVTSVEMTIADGLKSSGSVKLCKYPADLFASAGTSN